MTSNIKKIFIVSVALALSIGVFAQAQAFSGSGTGTQTDPFIITTCTELQSLVDGFHDQQYAELANDIDCSATATWNEDQNNLGNYLGFIPIYSEGILNGNGHTISNLVVNREPGGWDAGIFSVINSNAAVYDLTLENIQVNSSAYGNNVGALAGTLYGYVSGVNATGTISSTGNSVGGLVGRLQSMVGLHRSSFTGTVSSGGSYIGGIAGYMVNAVVDDVYASVAVTGDSYVGGIAGYMGSCCTTITRAYAAGTVNDANSFSGGIVGGMQNGGDVVIQDSFASVAITSSDVGGAVVGEVGEVTLTTNTYYDVLVEGSDPCFGVDYGSHTCTTGNTSDFYVPTNAPLSAWNFTTIWEAAMTDFPSLRRAYPITPPTAPVNLDAAVSDLTIDFTWAAPTSNGGAPVTGYEISFKKSTGSWSDPMLVEDLGDSVGWTPDEGEIDYQTSYDVRVRARNPVGYGPYVTLSNVTTGSTNSHDITSCAELQDMDSVADTYDDIFLLTQDIDCSGIPNFRPLGKAGNWNGTFRGVFDGQNHTISNLNISQPLDGDVGLFSSTYRAIIKNFTLDGGSVEGVYSIGAVVGYMDQTTLDHITSNIDVTGILHQNWGWGGSGVGGLAGAAESYGAADGLGASISNSSVSGDIYGVRDVGGLAGTVYVYPNYVGDTVEFSVTNNSFTGMVGADTQLGGSDVGGLFGSVELDSTSDDDTNVIMTISDNVVSSSSISGTYDIGGIAGTIDSYTEYEGDTTSLSITDNIVTGVFTTNQYTGGLVGYLNSSMGDDDQASTITIEGNSTSGQITSDEYYIGGLIGYSSVYGDYDNAVVTYTLSENRSLMSVSGQDYVGGLIGYFDHGFYGAGTFTNLLSKNYVNGTVTGTGTSIGGLIGYAYGYDVGLVINDSYFEGTITAVNATDVGGLVGYFDIGNDTDINRSYATGTLSSDGAISVGGLVGVVDTGTVNITDSFAAMTIDSQENQIGTVVGGNNDSLNLDSVYYDDGMNGGNLGCVDNNSENDCTPIDTGATPSYFINTSANNPMTEWDFSTIWRTETAKYPQLRTTFGITDATAPILTVISSPTGTVKAENAIVTFQSSETCEILASPITATPSGGLYQLIFEPVLSADTDIHATIQGMLENVTYSFSFQCRDQYDNISDLVTVGPFLVSSGGGIVLSFPGGGSTVGGGGGSGYVAPVASSIGGSNTPPPSDCLPGYMFSPSTGRACTGSSSSPATSNKNPFTRDLRLNMDHPDVARLQAYLNSHGFPVATSGWGSPGQEATTFGKKTQAALIKFQKANKITPASGLFGPKTRAFVNQTL